MVELQPGAALETTWGFSEVARVDWSTAPKIPGIDDNKLFGLVSLGNRRRFSSSAEVTGFDATPSPTRNAAIVAITA